ncbi:peptidase M42 [Aureliella helgolandensis]|uniref:Aminopeptidase YsdC n=1 Tax=Aureliella helgolandensis TaxID=2527968 RepID=A0A518G8Q4_9BACT|nr:peptidase M42 [Aureliella helgolandensis]QDV24968.1 Putative aminopeptidase YsdC [Aureliella helgolandensis]
MSDARFALMKKILSAPSPIGLEASMTRGVLEPHLRSLMLPNWKIHTFKGNAGIVLDTAPERPDAFSVMVIGHADKIRMQVRSIGEDGKIWVNSDSMLPTTLLGHKVQLFSENPQELGSWRILRGGTIEAIGAIHFADAQVRSGEKGIKADMLYLELHIHGEDKKGQVEALGIRPGDPIIFDRPIEAGFSPDTFSGAYLDNGLGCFVTAEIARLIAESKGLKNVRFLGAMASHEEIGRFGSRVLTEQFRPDVTIAVDVAHDFVAAPGISDRRYEPLEMGKGFTLTHGAVCSASLNSMITAVAAENKIPVQHELAGRDTGTDAMAAVLAAVDSAAASIGIPIRNMHTISESGHTGDVDTAIHGLYQLLVKMDSMHAGKGVTRLDLQDGHPRLDNSSALTHQPAADTAK